MSYARLAEDCGVYVYLDNRGYLCCCFCSMQEESFAAYTTADMLAHLQEHRDRGDLVPGDIDEDLREDAAENDAWIAEQR